MSGGTKTIFVKEPPDIIGGSDGMFRVILTDADGKQYRLIWTVSAFYGAYVRKGEAIREFERRAETTPWREPDED